MDIKQLIQGINENKDLKGEIIIRTENKEIEIRNVTEFVNMALANKVEKVTEDEELGYPKTSFEIDGWKISIPSRY